MRSSSHLHLNRRRFLSGSAAMLGLPLLSPSLFRPGQGQPLKIAAICSSFRYREHAHVILENFLEPYLFCGKVIDPRSEFTIACIYIDQTPEDDMGLGVARERGIPAFKTIDEALCLGGRELAVDAVLSIGEHGKYPRNEKGQVEYPRKRFFDEIAAVVERSGRPIPVFNDKHLSYRTDWAIEMVETARRLKMPLMAGSSVPLAERRPALEIPIGEKFESALSVHGGPVESYDFHGLEVLQSLVERRAGGETGVKSVRFLEGDALWEAAEAGSWSIPLADAALAAEREAETPPLRELLQTPVFTGAEPHGIAIRYVDGLEAIALKLGNSGTRWDFAARLTGHQTPAATSFRVGPWQNRNLFKALSHAIQHFFRTGVAPYPVERTLITTCVLDAAMDSRLAGGAEINTPQLADLSYQPTETEPFRETGASWRIVTEEALQPSGLDSAENYVNVPVPR